MLKLTYHASQSAFFMLYEPKYIYTVTIEDDDKQAPNIAGIGDMLTLRNRALG